jgi:hypothetical protein
VGVPAFGDYGPGVLIWLESIVDRIRYRLTESRVRLRGLLYRSVNAYPLPAPGDRRGVVAVQHEVPRWGH